jgi:hypothetical protein
MILDEFPFDDMDISDIYKEIYNIRPDSLWWKRWDRQDTRSRKRIWKSLARKSRI